MKNLLQVKIVVPFVIVAIVVTGIGLYLFQPWRLFTNIEVNESIPVAVELEAPIGSSETSGADAVGEQKAENGEERALTEPVIIAEGSFISHEHPTSGNVRILELPNGERILRIEGLETDNGPDLKVWLSDQPVLDGSDGWRVFDDGKYVNLGDLKGNRGNQNYVIPADVNLSEYPSVSIWCERFAVSFGAATLKF